MMTTVNKNKHLFGAIIGDIVGSIYEFGNIKTKDFEFFSMDGSYTDDSILTLAFGGIVYTPGSAGTLQEIFQDAVQNHYLTFGFASPMIFMGRQFWSEEMPVYPFMQQMMASGRYKNLLLSTTDSLDEVVHTLRTFRTTSRKES